MHLVQMQWQSHILDIVMTVHLLLQPVLSGRVIDKVLGLHVNQEGQWRDKDHSEQ